MPDRLRANWGLLLAFTVIAAIGIQLFDADYNKLQTARDAAGFNEALRHAGRPTPAAVCDIAFAVGYGLLGLVGLRALDAKGLLGRVGAILIAASAMFDELENLLLIRNVSSSRTLTDGWIDAMRVPGTLKWVGSPVLVVLLVLLVRRALTRRGA